MSFPRSALLAVLLLGCPSAEPDPDPTPAPADPRCGDGTVQASLGEGCDDGGLFGGDGCSPDCVPETLPGETEPNDEPESAQPLPEGGQVIGSVQRVDVDCFSVAVPSDGWLSAEVSGDGAPCPEDVVLRLYTPGGDLWATGSPGGEQGCAPIDPVEEPGARFMAEGDWAVCVAGFLDRAVPTYTLSVTVGVDSCSLPYALTSEDDIDGDGQSAVCDLDDDGDGYADEEDNCPELPNDGSPQPRFVDESGFIRDWLVLGPFPDLPSESSCLPSDEQLLGDDAAAEPSLGDEVQGQFWQAYFDSNARLNYLDLMGGPTPREVYTLTWVYSPGPQDLSLAMGIDDGGRAFLNGEEVFEIGSCQGTNVDQFVAPVQLLAGWNRLLVRVRDQGGGWGLYARFLDADDAPVTGLEVSVSGPQTFAPGQEDSDGDGVGDWCDDPSR